MKTQQGSISGEDYYMALPHSDPIYLALNRIKIQSGTFSCLSGPAGPNRQRSVFFLAGISYL